MQFFSLSQIFGAMMQFSKQVLKKSSRVTSRGHVQETSSFSSEVVHCCLTKVLPMFGSAGPQTSPI